MPQNEAAWLPAPKANPLEVKSAEYPSAKEDEIIVHVRAVGIDPVDNKVQDWNLFNLPTPIVLGNGVAGEVVETGSAVNRFTVGQRIICNTTVLMTREARNGGYQTYTAAPATLCAPVPDSMPFTQAAVLPVGISTAAAALFNPDALGVPMPPNKVSGNSTLVIWGGSSSVGLCATQLARLVGLRVVTTASPANAELCKSMGAAEVVDYHDGDCESRLVTALKDTRVVGAIDAISMPDTIQRTTQVLSQTISGKDKKVALTVPPMQEINTHGVELANVFSLSILGSGVAKKLWEDVLPGGLASAALQAKPDAMVEASGLEGIQAGLNRCGKGVSAAKVVVELP